MMTKLDEIRGRWAKATPGPWAWKRERAGFGTRSLRETKSNGPLFVVTTNEDVATWHHPDEDAIAHAPEDVAWLLGRLKRAETTLNEIADLPCPSDRPVDDDDEWNRGQWFGHDDAAIIARGYFDGQNNDEGEG